MRLFALPATLALAVGMSAVGYAWLATQDMPRDRPARASPAPRDDRPAELPDEHPIDVEGWRRLGRAYALQGRHADAVLAFRNATRLRPDDATLLTDYAFSAAVTTRRSVADEPQRLVERALRIDPNHAGALSLAGTLALDRNDYEAAVLHWERLSQQQLPDSPAQRQLRASIAQAHRLADAQGAQTGLIKAR
ncbi:MAG: tetratricopeptide repeat protein [Burkholderiales bacterium]